MLLNLLLDPNCQSVVAALERLGPSRFSRLQRATGLDNKTVSLKIKELRDAMVVSARTIPTKGERVWLEYRLTPRGKAMYQVLEDLSKSLHKDRALSGVAREFDQVLKPSPAVA